MVCTMGCEEGAEGAEGVAAGGAAGAPASVLDCPVNAPPPATRNTFRSADISTSITWSTLAQ